MRNMPPAVNRNFPRVTITQSSLEYFSCTKVYILCWYSYLQLTRRFLEYSSRTAVKASCIQAKLTVQKENTI
jgi:hypothetical protein